MRKEQEFKRKVDRKAEDTMRKKRTIWSTILLLTVALGFTILAAASVGSANITVMDSLRIILKRLPGGMHLVSGEDMKPVYDTIVWNVRLPRIFLAGLVGCGLSVVGAAFQGLFRNPLADPHILGVSSGAALGATLAMLSGFSLQVVGLSVVGMFAFCGALLTVFLVSILSKVGGRNNITGMLLTGTAISTLLSSIISLLMIFHQDQIEAIYLWTLGSFSAASWSKVSYVMMFTLLCCSGILFYAGDLNVILTGEDTAKSLGINIAKVKRNLIIVSSLLIAACVSVSGIIGFVGLIIPHCIRLMIGPNHKRLLPVACLLGAIFMIVCDTIARVIASPSEIPVGVVTALFGAPYFIFLLYNNQRKGQR